MTPAAAPNARPVSTWNPPTAAPVLEDAGAELLAEPEATDAEALEMADETDDATEAGPTPVIEDDSEEATDDTAPDEAGAVEVDREDTGPPGVVEDTGLALALRLLEPDPEAVDESETPDGSTPDGRTTVVVALTPKEAANTTSERAAADMNFML